MAVGIVLSILLVFMKGLQWVADQLPNPSLRKSG
jgi:hypothetical protein